MSLPPADWSTETAEEKMSREANLLAWENPEKPASAALLATIGQILWKPKDFFASLPLTGGLGEPLAFALLVGTTGLLGSLLWQLVLDGGLTETASGLLLSKYLGDFIQQPTVILGIFLLSPLIVALGQFLVSLCLLWATRLTGPEGSSYEGVFRLTAYSQAPAIFCLLPWVGALIAWVWNVILFIIGLSRIYGFSTAKAVFTLALATIFQGLLFLLLLLLSGLLGFWRLLFL